MIAPRSTCAIVAAVPALMLGGCAAHVQPTPMSVPAPLVSALLDGRVPTSGTPEYSVGTLPPAFPTALVPSSPVRIIGGMASGDEIVGIFADSTRRLVAVFEDLFARSGFTRPPPTPGAGFSSGFSGFSSFCSDSATVNAEQLRGPNRNLVRVTYRRERRGSSCAVFLRPAPRTNELKLPPLTPPRGVSVTGSRGGSGGDGVNSSAEMTGTELEPSAVVAHYAAQLVAAGWKASPAAVTERVAAQFFEATSAAGAPWDGVLMASGGGSTLSISLTMHARAKR